MIRLAWTASLAWLGCLVVGIVVEMPLQAFKEFAGTQSQPGWTDALAISLVVVATAWVYLHGLSMHPSRSALFAIGLLWAGLSVVCVVGYSSYLTDHTAMRFLTEVVVGGPSVPGGALWALVLLVQFCAPVSIGALRIFFSRRHRMIPRNAH